MAKKPTTERGHLQKLGRMHIEKVNRCARALQDAGASFRVGANGLMNKMLQRISELIAEKEALQKEIERISTRNPSYEFPVIMNTKVLEMRVAEILPLSMSLTSTQKRVRSSLLVRLDRLSQGVTNPPNLVKGCFGHYGGDGSRWHSLDRHFGKMGGDMLRQALNHYGIHRDVRYS